MTERFYQSDFPSGGTTELTGSEAHHLLHVMRGEEGECVVLFDGKGSVAQTRIQECKRTSVLLEILQINHEPVTSRTVWKLATAIPKGDRMKWLIEKATELGVPAVIPLLTERAVTKPTENKLKKLEQTIIGACKQSGRNLLLELESPTTWNSFLDSITEEQTLIVTTFPGEPIQNLAAEVNSSPQSEWIFCVGPEGGWTSQEIQQATERKAKFVSLGPQVLRIETAAIAIASWMQLVLSHHAGNQQTN